MISRQLIIKIKSNGKHSSALAPRETAEKRTRSKSVRNVPAIALDTLTKEDSNNRSGTG